MGIRGARCRGRDMGLSADLIQFQMDRRKIFPCYADGGARLDFGDRSRADEYKKSELDLLEFDHQKRNVTRKVRQKMFTTIEHMKIIK